MKLKHWVFVAFALMGVLFAVHQVMHHGGMQGFRSGLGLGG